MNTEFFNRGGLTPEQNETWEAVTKYCEAQPKTTEDNMCNHNCPFYGSPRLCNINAIKKHHDEVKAILQTI